MQLNDLEPLVEIRFTGTVIEWRGPAPFFFVAVSDEHVGAIGDAARTASYGWGVVPVSATIDAVKFTTSLFPRGGGYLLPLKDKLRRALGIALGEFVTVQLAVR